MDRRQFLVFGSITPILAACGGGEGTGPSKATGVNAPATASVTGLAGSATPGVADASGNRASRLGYCSDGRFLLDNRPFVMAAGELHPQRIPSEYWDHRIKMTKAMGFNTISIYDFWSEHVTYDANRNPVGFDFDKDRNNLGHFLDLCKDNNMWVFLRPGPFVDAYWDLGGIPAYLLTHDDMVLRTSTNATYMAAVNSYIAAIAPLVRARLSSNGGPILMVQVENEYTTYAKDTNYLKTVRDLWYKNGIGGPGNNNNVLMSTNNGINADGTVFNSAAALTDMPIGGDPFGINADLTGTFDSVVRRYNYSVPAFSSETYSGWDTMGSHPSMYPSGNAGTIATTLDLFLKHGVSFAVYVAHGGTSFGYGASGDYSNWLMDPNVTSYDYRAPINEQGSKAYNIADATGKLTTSSFDQIRNAFTSALNIGQTPDHSGYFFPYTLRGPNDPADAPPASTCLLTLPPPANPMIALSRQNITLKPQASIWDNLPTALDSTTGPLSCESCGVFSGCGAAYSTTLSNVSGTRSMTFQYLADVATVFKDGKLVAIVDRRLAPGKLNDASINVGTISANSSTVTIDFGPTPQSAKIDIFVYAFGHAHKEFSNGDWARYYRKGIWGGVTLSAGSTSPAQNISVVNWTMYPLPMTSDYIKSLKPLTGNPRPGMFYSATFDLQTLGDTYIDVSAWNLGVVWVNGHNIGRHFASTSPQKALFCPSTFLQTGTNQVVIFDNYVTDVSKVYIELLNVQSTYNSNPAVV